MSGKAAEKLIIKRLIHQTVSEDGERLDGRVHRDPSLLNRGAALGL